MSDRRHPPATPGRPHAERIPESQADALRRRQSLDEQQRTFRGPVSQPHIFRHRRPA
jgi:hypothetical protein